MELFFRAAVIGLLLAFMTSANAALISSNFDTGTEGWRLSGDATTSGARYSSAGFIFGSDRARGGLWYFEAPTKFLGDLSWAYDQFFNFELNYTGSGGTLSGSSFLTIFGGGSSLVMNAPVPSTRGSWEAYSFRLNETAGWLTSGIQSTAADIRQVLSDVTRIRIRGEFVNGQDTGRLDNVSVGVPEPSVLSIFGLALIIVTGYSKLSRNKG